jgi:pyruvate formate lyase activating enzyme
VSRMSSRETEAPSRQETGTVFNIQRFSIDDGPGIRTTVFMKGCPLRCAWCHNPEGMRKERQLMWFDVKCIGARDCLKACPSGALELTGKGMIIHRDMCDACGSCVEACPAGALEIAGRRYSTPQVLDEVLRDEAFYRNSGGGVTISGGEPTMQPEFVEELLKTCRGSGLHTALDTSGFCAPETLERLMGQADMVLLDLKVMDDALHRELTGVGLDPVLQSARIISGENKPFWIRTPVIPGATDSEDNIDALARFIADELQGVERWDLLTFNNTCGSKYRRLDLSWQFEGVQLLETARVEALTEMARRSGVKEVAWSGVTRRES